MTEGIRNKRILLTTESLGPVNGVSRTTGSLIEYLQRQGADLVVVCPEQGPCHASSQAPAEQTPLLAEAAGKDTARGTRREIRIKGQALPYNPDLTIVYPIHIDSIFNQAFPGTKPDIIYIASPASLGFQILLQTRQLRNPPTIHVNFQTDLSAYARILLPTPLSHYAVWLLDSVQGYLFRHSSVQTIFYPSSAIEEYLVNDTRIPRSSFSKLHRLGRGVDTALFSPARRDETYRARIAPNGEAILVCVCRLAPEKGFEFLAQVVRVLLRRNRRNIKLLIVGGNRNPVVENHIRALFHNNNNDDDDTRLADTVVFTGFLAGTELARAYAIADVFVHCSVTETFGLVVLESMACGVPVVARNQGGPADIIQHGRTGYLVSAEDVDGFVAVVEGVIINRGGGEERDELARNAREYALHTTWNAINARVASHLVRSSSSSSESGGGGGGDDDDDDGSPRSSSVEPGGITSGMASGTASGAAGMSVVEVVRVRVAVAIVYVMWLVAVVPLLVHGKYSV